MTSVRTAFEEYKKKFSVAFMLEVENNSNTHLKYHENKFQSGIVNEPPTNVRFSYAERISQKY